MKHAYCIMGLSVAAAALLYSSTSRPTGAHAAQAEQDEDASRNVVELQGFDFFGIDKAIKKTIRDFELETQLQKELLAFAFQWDVIPDKATGLSITLMLPKATGDMAVKRFSWSNPDQQFTLQMTKVYAPGYTVPHAVAVLAEVSADGGLVVREKIGFYDDTKGWQSPPSK